MESMTLELRLLLTCARVHTAQGEDAVIRQMLDEGIDWTAFARKAIDTDLAVLAGHTLARVAPDMVPDDILDALRINIDRTRGKNRALFDELARLIDALANDEVEAIPFKGPVVAIQAYGDLGLRVFGGLDFLIRDSDIAPTIATLRDLGYGRKGRLTEAQFEMIHRIQGREILHKKGSGNIVELHTRLTPAYMALDVDYAGLWRRAKRTNLNGRTMLTLTPEDDLLILAIHGGKDLWCKIKWACDVAALIGSQPKLDWGALAERARAQGCLRMVLLAVSLARTYFHATVPDAIAALERADPVIEAMVQRIMMRWQAEKPIGVPSNKTLSMDRLRIHDGVVRRARYVARTLRLPDPHRVPSMPSSKGLGFVYAPMRIVHDIIALPVKRAHRRILARARRLQDRLASRNFRLAIMLASGGQRQELRRHEAVRAAATRAIAANPNDLGAWHNLGPALFGLKRYKQAIACYDKTLVLAPDSPSVWKNRAAALAAINQKTEFPDIAPDSQDVVAWIIRAGGLSCLGRFAETVEASDRALDLDPRCVVAARMGIHARVQSCDWRRREDDKRRITAGLKAGQQLISAGYHRVMCDSEEENLIAARLTAKGFPPLEKALWGGERYRHDKIRIAYISTDFRPHAVACLIAGCFEHHDKTRFETTAISIGADSRSEMRRRIEAAFDHFIDVRAISNQQVAARLREMEIDIAIDLNGYTGDARSGILACRPAPIQVNYLGYPGTMGMPFIDYIIADRVVIPDENRIHYSEHVVYLPYTYQPNDRARVIAEKTPSRLEAGLPETGFVFACFNNPHKISPEMFDIWMRLLHAIDGSVLWLLETTTEISLNLRREAEARGIARERLVFAPVVPQQDYLARQRLADLFLDTRPYNAHTTASDALWAGLPVLTCPGNTFPSRVAASLLHAIGLPELVTASLGEYEEMARTLAQNPERLAAIKAKLMRNRDTEPLFDTASFTRYLESAYTTMWERQQAGLPPASFVVESAL